LPLPSLVVGGDAFVEGAGFPLYEEKSERTVFLPGSGGLETYALVFDESGCHEFDDRSGFKINDQTFGYTKYTCLAFCLEVTPNKH